MSELDVIYMEGLWLGAYEAYDPKLDRNGRYHIGLALSNDGKSWARMPAFSLEQNKQDWDAERICKPKLFHWEDKLYLFYSGGLSGTNREQIGLSETKLVPCGEEDYFRNDARGAWNGVSIDAGESTYGVPTLGYEERTVYFVTDTSGDLTIEVREPDGDWRTYVTKSGVATNELIETELAGSFSGMRVSFDTAATVSAWYNLRA